MSAGFMERHDPRQFQIGATARAASVGEVERAMKDFSRVVRVLPVRDAGVRRPSWPVCIPKIIACAIIFVAFQARGNDLAGTAKTDLETRIAELKAKTAELIARERTHLNTLPPQQRL